MKLYNAPLDVLREQDVNARILPLDDYNQLANNVKRRGRLESVPFCALIDGRFEIVSGHHRVKAARSVGLTHTVVLVDESGLSRSEIVAKQLAHNRLAGYDDPQTLRLLFDMLDDPMLQLETGLSDELLEEPPDIDWDASLTPRLNMDYKIVTFTFLDHQLRDFTELLEALPASDVVGVVDQAQFQAFTDAAQKVGRLKEIRSIGLIVAHLTEIARAEVQRAEDDATEST